MRALPWIISIVLHLGLLLTALFAPRQVEYGIDAGKNSVEVNLVAAPREATPAPAAPPDAVQETPPPTPAPDPDMAVAPTPPPQVPLPPTPQPEQPNPPAPKPVQVAKEHGDSSAPVPGKDATTSHTDAGAILSVKPDYLRNPPPVYPEECRRSKEEGLVVLDVIVGTEGRPESVAIQAGSGFAALDQAASKAVSAWRFRPAKLAGISVRSRVQVPVRFRLDG